MFWLDAPRTGELGEALDGGEKHPKPELARYDLGKRKADHDRARRSTRYAVSGDGTRLAYRKDGSLDACTAADAKDDEDAIKRRPGPDPRHASTRCAEWRQMYAENWRLMRDNFWRADMGGLDWVGDPRPVRAAAGARSARSTTCATCCGRCRRETRHLARLRQRAARGAPGRERSPRACSVPTWPARRRRQLADRAVLPSETSVAEGRSPLKAPGVAARAGDAIVAVDGRAVDAVRGPNALLVGQGRHSRSS